MAKLPIRLIPALAVVGGVLPACSDAILGDWELTRIKGKVLPKSYTDDGATYTTTAGLDFEDDGEVTFTITKTVTGTKTGTKSYAIDGTWDSLGKGDYIIRFEPDVLDCTIASKELECDDADGDRYLEAVPAN